jgi:chromosome segregation ATPase
MANPTSAPTVRLEVRHDAARPVTYDVTGDEFVVGSAPGCDLRLAGSNLPPVMCVVARSADGPRLRKLAPALPLLLNGRPVQTAALRAGDTISLGSLSILVHVTGAMPRAVGFVPITPSPLPAADANIAEHRHKLDEQAAELEADRVLWYRRREDMETECRERQQAIEAEQRRREELYQDAATAVQTRETECQKREQFHAQRDAEHQAERERIESLRAEVERREQEHSVRAAELDQQADTQATQQRQIEALRSELSAEKRDLHALYQERRGRLAGLQQAVETAARKVQDIKRELSVREQALTPRAAQLDGLTADLLRREQEVAAGREEVHFTRRAVAEEAERTRHTLASREQETVVKLRAAEEELARRQTELAERETLLRANEEQHRADLVRLDRFQSSVDERERHVAAAEAEVARQMQVIQLKTLELEEKSRQIDAAIAIQKTDDELLKRERTASEEAKAKLSERESAIESQQAMLNALRTRLERMRDEIQQESVQLADHRARHEAVEREVLEKSRAADELRSRVESDSQTHAAERKIFDSKSGELEASIARLNELQEKLKSEETDLAGRREKLEAQEAAQTTLAADLKGRATQLLELQEQLTADRLALKEREAVLAREAETRWGLTEQLDRRSEELAARQQQLDEQTRDFEAQAGEAGARHEAAGRHYQATEATLAAARQHIEHQMSAMRLVADRVTAVEAELARREDRLRAAGRGLALAKKAHAAAKAQWSIDHETAMAEARRLRAELEEFRRQAAADAESLREQLPDLELRGQAVLIRLGQAREELRGHLGELHDYARQGQDDLQSAQTRIRAEADRLQEQEATINKARSEHRIAVSAFRQQLLEWQGRVADMRRVLADDGARRDRKEAEVTAAAEQVDETAQQLARQAADLQAAEHEADNRRTEMEQRLRELRGWYRDKLRDLAEGSGTVRLPHKEGDPNIVLLRAAGIKRKPRLDASTSPGEPAILSLTDDLNPGDRKLGELLRSLELVDADTLTALLLEARRQRRTLRQVLLSGRGERAPLLTLYQLALIESGNLDALVLGPTRVIDRLHATAREAVYRVFDPRRTGEGQSTVLLRHLAESEMRDTTRPDDFRQRFAAQVALAHPHLTCTLEVLEIGNRPAVLQEWLTGLPAADWPPLTTMPAVWHRLLSQTAQGLHAAHQGGLVHGALSAKSIVLTPLGVVKVTGCGEPPWLCGRPADATAVDDLVALGDIAAGWAAGVPRRKGAKSARSLPGELQRILDRLRGGDASAGELVADLETAGRDLPSVGEAWDELMAFARENAAEGVALRKAA